MPAKPVQPLFLSTRAEWRLWLEAYFEKEREAWLAFPHKSSGLKRIDYNDAVEEALCFGWIDSTVKALDPSHSIQRFTPRNHRSKYSQPNRERLRWLADHKLIHPSIMKKVEPILKEKFVFPPDILDALQTDPEVWKNYLGFSESYRRLRVAYIDDARKRPEEFLKRLSSFMEKTRQNKMIRGFGGIDKYY